MKIIRTLYDMTEYRVRQRDRGASVGFVPTMGALHEGHMSLVNKAVKENEVVVVSLFVNPIQFNNADDFDKYPRTEEEDFKLLAAAGVDAVFAPTAKEMYPDDNKNCKEYNLGGVAEVMEGKYRPGHFQGVARVLDILFRLVNPHRAYFGEKDFQQIAVVRNLIKSEGLDVEIVACPIKRSPDGLALSSRNARLDEEQRKLAPEIYATLKYSVEYSQDHSVRATHDTVVERIDAIPGMRVEYFEIVDARTLQPVEEWEESNWIVGCITVFCGDVRLIDNIAYRLPN
ncbi:MAG: pantoate--beta-alanine ligase [Muribaculaceae bacterium]|nr:pantoate--beta-alanine ligase [Muribaculaceae bacterium]